MSETLDVIIGKHTLKNLDSNHGKFDLFKKLPSDMIVQRYQGVHPLLEPLTFHRRNRIFLVAI